jgi:hypothetical protein
MWTAILNPTNWLLMAIAAGAIVAPRRLWHGGVPASIGRSVPTFVIAGFVCAAVATAGARIVWGYVAPGAYLEEVAAARLLVDGRDLSVDEARDALTGETVGAPAPRDWLLEGLSSCHAGAVTGRASFFTSHGHPPFLLAASMPIVAIGGGRALFIVLTLLSVAAVLVASRVLVGELAPDHAAYWPVLPIVLLGWQPVLAGLRHGDVAFMASALAVVAWAASRRGRDGVAGVAAGIAASISPGLVALVPALAARSRRAFGVALATIASGLTVAMVAGGAQLLQSVASSGYTAAETYAVAGFNYSLLGRALTGTRWATILVLLLAGLCVAAAVRRAGRAPKALGTAVGPHDAVVALFCCLAVVISPVAWSQQVSFLLLPLAVLLTVVVGEQRPVALVVWCVLTLLVSFPDQVVSRALVATAAATGADPLTTIPVPVAATTALAVWLALMRRQDTTVPETVTRAYATHPGARAGLAGGQR